jgi:putative hemolysin
MRRDPIEMSILPSLAKDVADVRGPRMTAPSLPGGGLVARWAESESDLREAQRLRYRVFAEEMGARLHPFAGAPAGHDVDRFDACCEHLLVRTVAADGTPGAVVGTYRLLTPSGARRAGGWYSDAEFDLAPLVAWRPRTVELGRSCVDPAWRSGGVILLLWTALCHYMAARGFDAMIGCASMPMDGEGALASAVWHQLKPDQLAPDAWRWFPIHRFGFMRMLKVRSSRCPR